MININKFLLQKGGNAWQTLITPIYDEYGIPYNPNDYISILTAEAAWEQVNKDIDNFNLNSEEKIRIKKNILEKMIQYIEKNKINQNWNVKINGKIISPKDYLLQLNIAHLKSFDTTVNPVDSLKTNLQSMISDVVQTQEDNKLNNQNLQDVSNLINTLKKNLQQIKTTSTQSVNLNNLKLVLEKAITKISENSETGIEINSDVSSINNLIKTLNSDLNTIRATPVAKNELLELKQVEAQLRLFKKKLSDFLSEINKRDSQKEEDITFANENITKLQSELKDLVKAFSQKGGELNLNSLDPNNILEKDKNELIPKGKYTKNLITDDNFILNCSGHKWSICDEFENVKDVKKKWIKAKLNMGWIKPKYNLSDDDFNTLETIRVLFKIDRDDNQYTFIKGKKAYLILRELDNGNYLVTKLLEYNSIHYLKKNPNLDSVDYNIINVENDNAEKPKTKKDMFPEIWSQTNKVNREKQEEQKKQDDKNLFIKKLYFDIFKEKDPLPLPKDEISEVDKSIKIYTKDKLSHILPQNNLVATEDDNGNIFYINNYDGSKVEYNFGNNRHYKVYDEDMLKKFNLFGEEWHIVKDISTSVAGKVENVIVPDNFVLTFDYEIEAFVFGNLYTGFTYWGIPLLKYSTDTFFVSYSPHFNSIYIMDMLKFKDDKNNDFVINSFEPDEFTFKLQVNILKILEFNRNKDNFSLYKSLFDSINELSNKFLELKPKIDSLTSQYANNTEILKINNELIKLQENKNKLESDLKSISGTNITV